MFARWLALILLAFAFCAGAAHAKPPFVLSINMLANGTPAEIEARFKRVKSLGMTEARLDWEWRSAEKIKGTYDWTTLDTLVSLAKKHEITLLPIVHYAPAWALPDKTKPEGVFEMAPRADAFPDYAKFLAASIDRYGHIKNWQVWNEPNIKEFWGPKPNPSDFLALMHAVEKELGDRRGKITLVHAGLSKADYVFLWQLWELDANYGRLFDVMALHPYFFNPRGGVRAVDEVDGDEDNYAALGFIGSSSEHGFLSKVFNVQLYMTLKGAPKPIWITEIGFMAGDKNPYAISEQAEAELAAKTLDYIAGNLTTAPFGKGARKDLAARVERVYWFALDDYAFPQDMGNFGLYRLDGSERPQAAVIKERLAK